MSGEGQAMAGAAVDTVEKTHSASAEIITALSAFAWPILIGLILWYSKSILKDIILSLSLRIKAGAAFETPWFKVEAVNVSTHTDLSGIAGISSIDDNNKDRETDRSNHYKISRNIILVHKLFPSSKEGQLYDILVYVISHKIPNAMLTIKRVEYYFGPSWPGRVFISEAKEKNFGLAISSFGPSLCTAKVFFSEANR